MSDLDKLMVLVTIAILLAIAFIWGWNAAVGKHRAGRKTLKTRQDALADQVDALAREKDNDPQRAWTNVGAGYVIGRVQNTLDDLREELTDRAPKP